MNENEIRSLFKVLADEAVPPSGVHIWPAVQQAYKNRLNHKSYQDRTTKKFALFLAGSVAVVLAIIFLVGPQNVVAAFRNLMGYLPGIGFVQNVDQAYVLSEPVALERDGIMVTILEAYADSEQTVVVYQVQGLPASSSSETVAPLSPYLVLQDGSKVELTHGDGGGKDGYWRERLGFPLLGTNVESVTLVIPRLRNQSAGAAPENWQLVFQLVPASESAHLQPLLVLTPVPGTDQVDTKDVATSTNPSAEPISTTSLSLSSTPDPFTSMVQHGVKLRIDSVSQAKVGIILGMTLQWEDPKWRLGSPWGRNDSFTVTDAKGNLLAVTQGEPPVVPSNSDQQFDSQIFTLPSNSDGPYTVTLKTVDFRANGQGSFPFDPGSSPQIGQEWSVDQTVTIGGHDLHVIAARILPGGREQSCLQFDIGVDAGVRSLALSDYANFDHVRGANATWNSGNDLIQTAVCYDVLPPGQLSIQVDSLFFTINGPWQITFDLPDQMSPISEANRVPVSPVPFYDSATSNPTALQTMIVEIDGYKQKLNALASQPGWTHLKYQQQEFLPSGAPRPAPQHRVEEYWDHINEEGKIFEQVEYWTSAETGKTLVGYRVNGELVSVWNSERAVAQPHAPTYDFYLASTLHGMIENKRAFQLTREETRVDEIRAVRFDLWIPYSEQDRSLMNVPLPGPAWGTYERFYIDPASGRLLQYEHFYVLETGEQVLSTVTSQIEIQTGVTPPQEVLDTLAQER